MMGTIACKKSARWRIVGLRCDKVIFVRDMSKCQFVEQNHYDDEVRPQLNHVIR